MAAVFFTNFEKRASGPISLYLFLISAVLLTVNPLVVTFNFPVTNFCSNSFF